MRIQSIHTQYSRLLTSVLLILTTTAPSLQAQDIAPARYNAWEQSLNPAGIHYTPVDSLIEAKVGYLQIHTPLALSEQPERKESYNVSADGYQRLGRLQLTGGLAWQQNQLSGHRWNFLILPDYIVASGDTINEKQTTEQYRIYGKAAYEFPSGLIAGLSGDYTATDNRENSEKDRYKGSAHTTRISAGLVQAWEAFHVGISITCELRNELLSYGIDYDERLYTYPMGYFIPMDDFYGYNNLKKTSSGMLRSSPGNSYSFRSTGNNWQTGIQAELMGNGWNWFNELNAGYQRLNDNPNDSENMQGWKERFTTIRYNSRLTLNKGRWTHLVSPALYLQLGISDRVLQHPVEYDMYAAWKTYATIRFASRNRADVSVQYEFARDYTPLGSSLAWQASAGWQYRKETLYIYPYTVSQHTGVFRGEIALQRRLTLPAASQLTFRPSIAVASGEGVEEAIERTDNPAEAVRKSSRDYNRVSHDFAARTATRSHLCLQVEYRRPITRTLSAGIRLQAAVEQIWEQKREAQGQARACLIIWL